MTIPGAELHAWGDMTPVGRDVSGYEKYPVEEGPKYRNRRGDDKIHPEQLGRDMSDMQGATVDYADVGELIGLTDLLHQAAATQEKTMTPEDSLETMTPEEFLEMIGQEAGLAADEPGGGKDKKAQRRKVAGPHDRKFNSRLEWQAALRENQPSARLVRDGDGNGLRAMDGRVEVGFWDDDEGYGKLWGGEGKGDEQDYGPPRDRGRDPSILGEGEDDWAEHPDARHGSRQRQGGGGSPSRELTNVPAVVINETRIRLENRDDWLKEHDAELDPEDQSAFNLLEEESERRGIGASRRTAAMDRRALVEKANAVTRHGQAGPPLTVDSPAEDVAEWLQWNDPDGRHSYAGYGDEEQAGTPMNDAEAWARLADMLGDTKMASRRRRTAGEMPPQFRKKPDGDDIDPIASADHGVDQGAEIAENDALSRIEDALETLEAHDLDPDAQQGVDEIGDAVEELQDLQAGEDDADDDAREDSPDEDGDNDDEKKNPFAKASAHQWGRRIEAAIRLDNAPRPRFEPDFVIGAEKTAAADLEFDIFGGDSSDFYTSAEHSIAGMAVNRFTERRGRFVPPSPQLINACAIVLRKTLGKIKASYSVDHYDLSKFASHTINPVDGSTLNGEITWHAILSNHARGRRGSVDLVLQIVGGAPAAMVEVLAGNQRIPFTRQAIDRHLNIRRDRTRGFHHNSPVEVAVISE